ncbi:TPA: response regulator, partial [bacterium]|nr:response regulator [bacterium]
GRIYDVTNFYIATYIEGSPTYDFAIHIENGERVPLTSRQSDKGLTGYILRTRKPLLMKNPEENRAFHEREGVVSMGVPAVSWMGVPLLAGSELVGVMVIQSYTTPDLYTEHDLNFLFLIGTELAFAIQNARLFEAQQKAIAVAEDANRMKSTFLAKISHELRTPLNAIINFAYLLNQNTEGALNPGQAELIRRIEESGRHLLGLINDILDLAKIEAGKMELNLEPVELIGLVKEALSTIQVLIAGKQLVLNTDLLENTIIVRGDAKRLKQVMLNLLSNAIKFTDNGTITVKTTLDMSSGMVTVSVSDTGRGISKDNLEKIFMEFEQATKADADSGTGLGLPISKHFIEMHGGTLTAESKLGEGSTFYFTLPVQSVSENKADEQIQIAHSVSKDKTKVIIIDDDEETRILLSRSLIGGRYNVVTLQDSRISLQTVKSVKPDVVLLDIMMPNVDGWSILKALREDSETKNIPVVICSIIAHENKAVVIEASDYISKPINPKELKDTIHKYAIPGKTVLAIDDDPNALEIIKRILDSISLEIKMVQDGKFGLDAINADPPGVIILDLLMPGMNGIDVLNELKKKDETKDIPIIVVTAKELNKEEHNLIINNTSALLQKGMFRPEDLSNLIESIIKKNKVNKKP